MTEELQLRLSKIRLLALDIDGTLTDGGLYFSHSGEELKRFNVQDGMGIALARGVDLATAFVTGRVSGIISRRATDLGIPANRVFTGIVNKAEAIRRIATQEKLQLEAIAFMGDDLNDLPAMSRVGVSLAPANGVEHVRKAADWVTERRGGDGAVREAIELILTARGEYDTAVRIFLEQVSSGQ